MKLTRRELPKLALAAAAPAQTPDEELQAARASLERNAAALDKVSLPVETEPAFQFKP